MTSATAQQQGESIARPGANTTSGWDFAEYVWIQNVRLERQKREHFGLSFYGAGGKPLTTNVVTSNSSGVFENGRGRTPWLTQTDLQVGHEFKFRETKRLGSSSML